MITDINFDDCYFILHIFLFQTWTKYCKRHPWYHKLSADVHLSFVSARGSHFIQHISWLAIPPGTHHGTERDRLSYCVLQPGNTAPWQHHQENMVRCVPVPFTIEIKITSMVSSVAWPDETVYTAMQPRQPDASYFDKTGPTVQFTHSLGTRHSGSSTCLKTCVISWLWGSATMQGWDPSMHTPPEGLNMSIVHSSDQRQSLIQPVWSSPDTLLSQVYKPSKQWKPFRGNCV